MSRILVGCSRCPLRRSYALEGRVKPESTTQAEIQSVGEEGTSTLRSAILENLNFPNRRIRTRTYGGVGGK
jgi:hypothetical protein